MSRSSISSSKCLLLHTIQHTHASQMHMFSQIKCVFTQIYFNRFPKGGTSQRPLVLLLRRMNTKLIVVLEYQIPQYGNTKHYHIIDCFWKISIIIMTTKFCLFQKQFFISLSLYIECSCSLHKILVRVLSDNSTIESVRIMIRIYYTT